MGMVPWLNLQGAQEKFNLSWLLARMCSVGDRPLLDNKPLRHASRVGWAFWRGRSDGANAEVHAWQSQPVHKEGFCYALGVVELPVGKGQGLHSTLLWDAPVQGTGSIGLGIASNTAYVSLGEHSQDLSRRPCHLQKHAIHKMSLPCRGPASTCIIRCHRTQPIPLQ